MVQQTVWIGNFTVEKIDAATLRLTVTELPPASTVNNHKQHMLGLLGPAKGNCIVGTLSCSTDNRICEIYELDTASFFETVLQWDSNGRKRSLSTTKDEFLSEGCKQLMALFRQHDPVRAEVAVQKIRGTWFDNKIKLVDTTHMSNMWAFDQVMMERAVWSVDRLGWPSPAVPDLDQHRRGVCCSTLRCKSVGLMLQGSRCTVFGTI